MPCPHLSVAFFFQNGISTLVSIPGYRINEELYNGSRTIVDRAVRENDSVPVVIKMLMYKDILVSLYLHNTLALVNEFWILD
ncbi:hypothetical protein H6G35_27940 [Aulosira sp. FACHB-113]|nr:hypothetical protein [Aulosira sp. FACHB-113]